VKRGFPGLLKNFKVIVFVLIAINLFIIIHFSVQIKKKHGILILVRFYNKRIGNQIPSEDIKI